MKKNSIHIAFRIVIFGLLLPFVVACSRSSSKSDVDSADVPMTFAVDIASASLQSKGTLVYYGDGVNDENLSEFGVYAFDASDNAILDNRKVYLSGSDWLYDNQINWPIVGDVDFFALAPYTADESAALAIGVSSLVCSSSSLQIDFTMPSDVTTQPDLMVAVNAAATAADKNGVVELNFNHQFVALNFTLTGSSTLKVDKITAENLYSSATLTVNASDGVSQWSNFSGGDSDFSLLLENDTVADPDKVKDITPESGYLFIIPQSPTDYSQVRVTIVSSDENQTWSVDRFIPLVGSSWQAGMIYTYPMTLTDSGTDSQVGITFGSVTVTPWGEQVEIDDEFKFEDGQVQ